MAKNFEELRARMSPERRIRVEQRIRETIASMPIAQVRKAREMTQIELALRMGKPQGEISKIENRLDVHVSTLKAYIEALGGHLVLRAEFPGGPINLSL